MLFICELVDNGGEMYLPEEINDAKILITVKTYPMPTPSHNEVVCTAGLLFGKKWVRIYPINFRDKPFSQQFSKYSWLKMDIVKNSKDFRVESYIPKRQFEEEMKIIDHIDTDSEWRLRREIVCSGEVFDSMSEAISLAKNEDRSLVTLKPKEIIDFIIEDDDPDWSDSAKIILQQQTIFEYISGTRKETIKKLPYRYSYKFLSQGDDKPRKMMITDWEIGALYWNCLKKHEDPVIANQKVREKYFNDFCSKKDIFFFLGTTYRNHRIAKNPYIIVGVFYPPKKNQLTLFE